MEELVKFTKILRKLGFNVSTDELISLTYSLTLINPTEEQFKSIVRSFLIKNQRDFAFFDIVFAAFFSSERMEYLDEQVGCSNKEDSLDFFELTSGGSADGKGLASGGAGGEKHKLAHLIRLGDYQKASEMVEAALNQLSVQKMTGEELLNQTRLKLDWHMEHYHLEKMTEGQPAAQVESWHKLWLQLEEKLNREVIKKLLCRASEEDLKEVNQLFNFNRKDFNKLSEAEYQLMKREVIQIGQKLATSKSRLWRKSKRGSVDLKNTIRHCWQGNGVPLKIYRRKHKVARPNIVLLCDVSSSVVNYSAFMLLLVYSMEQSFKKIRSFIFIDDLEDVSPYFSKYGLEEAVELLTVRASCSTSGFSDFGRVFKTFEQKYLDLLTPKTNFIVLGDAKNNYRATEIESFIKISESCHRVWWLNPQAEEFWGQDDSIMGQYGKYCTGVWECRYLEQLKSTVRRIYR